MPRSGEYPTLLTAKLLGNVQSPETCYKPVLHCFASSSRTIFCGRSKRHPQLELSLANLRRTGLLSCILQLPPTRSCAPLIFNGAQKNSRPGRQKSVAIGKSNISLADCPGDEGKGRRFLLPNRSKPIFSAFLKMLGM
jgi:hypothetical protein